MEGSDLPRLGAFGIRAVAKISPPRERTGHASLRPRLPSTASEGTRTPPAPSAFMLTFPCTCQPTYLLTLLHTPIRATLSHPCTYLPPHPPPLPLTTHVSSLPLPTIPPKPPHTHTGAAARLLDGLAYSSTLGLQNLDYLRPFYPDAEPSKGSGESGKVESGNNLEPCANAL